MSENSRFQHLLQPIRDLSKNWNIDLAQELEEYMDQLDNLAIRFDPEDEEASAASFGSQPDGDDAKVMNFAEAALLIQGTSAIYSRKVEYLHALVFQTLGHLSKQQEDEKQRQKAQQNGQGGDEDDEDEDGFGASLFANPLPLYDELDEAKPTHITLKQVSSQVGQEESEEMLGLRRQERRGDAAQVTKSKHNIQANIALMGSLVPDERDHGETFKLLSCNMHVTGVLLLDEASKKYLGEQQRAAGDQPLAFGETPGRHGAQWRASDGSDPATALDFDHMDATDDDAGLDAGDNKPEYDFDDGEQASEVPEHAQVDGFHSEGSSSRRLTRVPLAADAKDPWTPLDAYDASSSVARPFRKGRSYPKVPAYKKKRQSKVKLSNKDGVVGQEDDVLEGLEDPQFQERFLTKPQWASWVWTETASENALEKTCKRAFCRAPLLVKNCESLWARERKWRSVMRRSKAREQQSAQAMLLREQAAEEDEADALTLHSASARLDLAFRSNALDARDAEQEDEDDGDFDAGFDGGDWDQAGELDDPTGAFSAEAMARSTSDDGPLSYDEICRQHLASFMSGTEKYVRETDLSKQVSEWQLKLAPLLKQQDTHPPFDIQQCGREILGRLEDQQPESGKKSPPAKRTRRSEEPTDEPSGQAVPFETLVDGKQQFEVCRLFLASLQLANSGNVALSHAHRTADHGRVPFQMQLLTTTNAYESLQA